MAETQESAGDEGVSEEEASAETGGTEATKSEEDATSSVFILMGS